MIITQIYRLFNNGPTIYLLCVNVFFFVILILHLGFGHGMKWLLPNLSKYDLFIVKLIWAFNAKRVVVGQKPPLHQCIYSLISAQIGYYGASLWEITNSKFRSELIIWILKKKSSLNSLKNLIMEYQWFYGVKCTRFVMSV